MFRCSFVLLLITFLLNVIYAQEVMPPGNPLFKDVYIADSLALVVGDTAFLYTGHDGANPLKNIV